jgi:cytoskeletal protein RodZ
MNDEKSERVLEAVDPDRRAVLKKLMLAATFSVPIVLSFSVRDLAQAATGSGPQTTSTASTISTTTETATAISVSTTSTTTESTSITSTTTESTSITSTTTETPITTFSTSTETSITTVSTLSS